MSKQPIVSIVKGTNVSQMVEQSLDLIGGLANIIQKTSTVIIKPNILMATAAPGAITNPKVIESIVELVKRENPKEIVIAESSMVSFDTDEAFKVSGMLDVANKTGVKWLNLKKDKIVQVPVPNGKQIKTLKLPETIVKSDVIINVPVMKTHVQTGVSLGLKNLKGCMPDEEKKRFHSLKLDQCIADLNTVIKTSLTIMDGTTGLEGFGPENPPGTPKVMNLIMASRDPVALDSVTAKIMGFDPKKVRHIANAARMGIGTSKISEIEVRGQRIQDVETVFDRPPKELSAIPGINLIDGSPCSSCVSEFLYGMGMLEKYKLAPKIKNLIIAIGPKAKIPDKINGKLLLLGKCVEKHKDRGTFEPGCPPFVFDPIAKLYGLENLVHYMSQPEPKEDK